jgi:hypothetical protein
MKSLAKWKQQLAILNKQMKRGVDVTAELWLTHKHVEALEAKEREQLAMAARCEICEQAMPVAADIDLSWVGDDVELEARILSGIASKLQRLDVNGEGYYDYLVDKVYGTAEPGEEFASAPELRDQLEERFEKIRQYRWNLKVLREAVKMKFEDVIGDVDMSDMKYPIKLEWYTDQQVRNQQADNRAKATAEQREQNEKIRESARVAWAVAEGRLI